MKWKFKVVTYYVISSDLPVNLLTTNDINCRSRTSSRYVKIRKIPIDEYNLPIAGPSLNGFRFPTSGIATGGNEGRRPHFPQGPVLGFFKSDEKVGEGGRRGSAWQAVPKSHVAWCRTYGSLRVSYAFYVLRIVRVIHCVGDVSVANGPLSQINLIWSELSHFAQHVPPVHSCRSWYTVSQADGLDMDST